MEKGILKFVMIKINESSKLIMDRNSKIILNKDSKVMVGNFLGPHQRRITSKEARKFLIPSGYSEIEKKTLMIGGVPYYCKSVSEEYLINSLIGTYLCKKIDLDCVDYKIGKDKGRNWCVLSRIFYKEGYQYIPIRNFIWEDSQEVIRCTDIRGDCFYGLRMETLKFYKKNPQLYDELLRLIAVDLKMGQGDRACQNVQIKKDSDGIFTLAPIYDFCFAYTENISFTQYTNPFMTVRTNFISLLSLLFRCPKLLEYVEYLRSFPMTKILEDIEKEENIQIHQCLKDNYEKAQKHNEKSIRKIKRIF